MNKPWSQRQFLAMIVISAVAMMILLSVLLKGNFSRKLRKKCYAGEDPCMQFHLMSMYFSVELQKEYAKKFSPISLAERNKEYLAVLQSNLNHPCVKRVHLFYTEEQDLKTVLNSSLTNTHKLVPVKQDHFIEMSDFFVYASRNLVGKPAVAANADIVLSEGWDLIDVDKMLKEKLFYSLSRYEGNLTCPAKQPMCAETYAGSHDTHVFALKEPLDEKILLKRLNYPTNMNQAENGMIYTMRHEFKFNVTNPCYTVKTYHHHCSPVHGGRGNSYTIYNLGWTGNEISNGVAKPQLLH